MASSICELQVRQPRRNGVLGDITNTGPLTTAGLGLALLHMGEREREKERERGTIRETETGVKVLGSEKPSLPSFAAWTARRYVTALSQEIGYHDQRGIDKGPQWGFWAIS